MKSIRITLDYKPVGLVYCMYVSKLLREMEENYSVLRTYQDTGTVSIASYKGIGDIVSLHYTDQGTFATLFKRPNLLRFEYREWTYDHSEELVSSMLSDGHGIFARRMDGQITSLEQLQVASDGSLTIRSSWAPPITALLVGDVLGPKVTNLRDVEYLGEEVINGSACHRFRQLVVGSTSPRELNFWISTASLLLVKSQERTIYDVVRSSVMTRIFAKRGSESIDTEALIDLLRSSLKDGEPRLIVEDIEYRNVIVNAEISVAAFTL